ncbi:hypothetical protein B296_00048016 [Ensete ventricosum]|uniref:Uncharacterized protein n=1 Tax=Ensete ventricosum TaxID=4639 RepID=A0A426YWT7_ENSVE|nr:hypothetical protein B296_00048016 [Ensete ventricosum]
MFNRFGAIDCIKVWSCSKRRLRQFPESRSVGLRTVGTTPRVTGTIFDLACPGYRVVEMVVHVVPRLTHRG